MDAYRVAFNTWQEKTEWVQQDKRFDVLLPWGKHRADVLKEYIDHLEAKCAALAAENSGLNAFVDALLSIAWQGGSADGAEIQEMALKHDLLRQEVYSADEHETLVDDPGNFEDGDPVYFRVETPATDAFLAEVRAQGVDSAINRVIAMMNHQHPVTSKAIDIMRVHAYQLRKGEAS